jgi:hypothetical protein
MLAHLSEKPTEVITLLMVLLRRWVQFSTASIELGEAFSPILLEKACSRAIAVYPVQD